METSTKKSFVVKYLFYTLRFEEDSMSSNISRRTAWILALLVFGLILTACGNTATPAVEAPPPTEESVTAAPPAEDTPVMEEEAEPTNTPEEEVAEEEPTAESAAEEEAATGAESESEEAKQEGMAAACVAADPNTDPIAGAILFLDEYIESEEATSSIAPVTDADWAKGPADAAITIIEFGDFQ